MNCIYLLEGFCTAQATAKVGRIVPASGYYKPTDDELKRFCNNGDDFKEVAPEFMAYQSHLQILGLKK